MQVERAPYAPLPEAHFRIKTFERRILPNDAIDAAVVWNRANLNMCDAYGGPTRRVVVEMAWASNSVLLKSVESLPKREFEELFGFSCGGFKKDRVISFAMDVLAVD